MERLSSENVARRKSSLKKGSDSDTETSKTSKRKTARFDEENIKNTYRPADKDYGFDKIDEPKTPYERDVPAVDANLLAERLLVLAEDSESDHESPSDIQIPGTSVQRESRQSGSFSLLDSSAGSFAEKRKKHIQSEFIVAKQACTSDTEDPASRTEQK